MFYNPKFEGLASFFAAWRKLGGRKLRKITATQGAADQLTERAIREGDLVAGAPVYDLHRIEQARRYFRSAVACAIAAVTYAAVIAFVVDRPGPLHLVAAALLFLGSAVFWIQAHDLGHDLLPSNITASDWDRFRTLYDTLGEGALASRSLLALFVKPAALGFEGGLCALVILLAVSMQIPFVFALAAAAAVGVGFTNMWSRLGRTQISEHCKRIEARQRYHRLCAHDISDEATAARARAFHDAIDAFVRGNFLPVKFYEKVWPYAVVAAVLVMLLAFVALRSLTVEPSPVEKIAMITAALIAASFYATYAFDESNQLSAGGREGLIANRIIGLFPTKRALIEYHDRHRSRIHAFLNEEFARFQAELDEYTRRNSDPLAPVKRIVLKLPYPSSGEAKPPEAPVRVVNIKKSGGDRDAAIDM